MLLPLAAVCAPGYGIPSCKPDSQDVGDCTICDFGTYHSGSQLRCSLCPTTYFNHAVGDTYVSYGITFSKGLDGPETCVPRYAQLPAPAGNRMAIDNSLLQVTTAASYRDCIEGCQADQCCIAQFEAQGSTCKRALLPPVGPAYTGASLYYKLPPSATIAAANVSANVSMVWARTQAAGVYARCSMSDAFVAKAKLGLVGSSTNPQLVETPDLASTVEWGECTDQLTCRLKCENNAACWGFIYVPDKGWATRGGEDQIGTRSFFVSPDFSQAGVSLPCSNSSSGGTNNTTPTGAAGLGTSALVCPAGYGKFFDCSMKCPENTWNDGSKFFCEACAAGYESGIGATNCTRIQPTGKYREGMGISNHAGVGLAFNFYTTHSAGVRAVLVSKC